MEEIISSIKQRVLFYADYKEFSKRKIYTDTGLSNGILDKNTGLSEDGIVKILKTYTEINPEWLILGIGEMIRSNYSISNTNSGNQQISVGERNEQYISLGKDERLKLLEEKLKDREEKIEFYKEQIEFYKNK